MRDTSVAHAGGCMVLDCAKRPCPYPNRRMLARVMACNCDCSSWNANLGLSPAAAPPQRRWR